MATYLEEIAVAAVELDLDRDVRSISDTWNTERSYIDGEAMKSFAGSREWLLSERKYSAITGCVEQ